MRSHQILPILQKQTPPKFVRRSMSPIDYINTPEYKLKLKKQQINVQFSYVSDKKIQKIGIRKRNQIVTRVSFKQKIQNNENQYRQQLIDKDKDKDKDNVGNNFENSFVKNNNNNQSINNGNSSRVFANNNNSYCSFDRSMGKFNNTTDTNNSTDFLTTLQDDSLILKAEISARNQYLNTSKKILQLQSQIIQKDKTIQCQQIQITQLSQNYSKLQKKQSFLTKQVQKLKLMLTMQQRNNNQKNNHIKMLKMQNKINNNNLNNKTTRQLIHIQNKRSLKNIQNVENMINVQKMKNIKKMELELQLEKQNKQNMYLVDNFQLSPDQDQYDQYSK